MSHKFLEPIKIGNQTVKNRVMFLAMAKNISNFDDSVSAKDIAYVESVAAGGVGLLVPGAMIVDPEWPSVLPLQPGIYDDRFLVKPTKSAAAMMPNAEMELPYDGAKKMLLVDDVDNKEFLRKLLEAMYEELPATKKN